MDNNLVASLTLNDISCSEFAKASTGAKIVSFNWIKQGASVVPYATIDSGVLYCPFKQVKENKLVPMG